MSIFGDYGSYRKEKAMKNPCGTKTCWRWLMEMGYDEPCEAACWQCGYEGPMFDYYNS